MGAVANSALSNGGQVTGIIPEFLIDMEATRHSLGQLNELIVTPDMHARKHTMFERSDALRRASRRHRHAGGNHRDHDLGAARPVTKNSR